MKALFIEPFAGISGNMMLGALIDAGVPFAYLEEEFRKLHLGEYELVNKSVNKSGIQARYFNVVLPEEHHHEHVHEHSHEHEHEHDHSHGHHHEHEHDDAHSGEEIHDHAWMHAHGIAHSHGEVKEEYGHDHHTSITITTSTGTFTI